MKILLFDDHKIFGESLSRLLEERDEISICRYMDNEADFWTALYHEKWDIVLLDVNLRKQANAIGIDLIQPVLEKKPDTKVVMLSSYDMPFYKQAAMKKGAVGFIDKSASTDELIDTLLKVYKGFEAPAVPVMTDFLTAREIEIIKAIGTGKTKREIAGELYISERTLYNHIQNIYEKLEAGNAIEAYNKAISLGYIEPLM